MEPPSLHDISSSCSALLAPGIITSCLKAAGLLGMKHGICPAWRADLRCDFDQPCDARLCCAQGLVTLFVMIGLGIVFGLPYLVARNRRMRKERGSSSAPSALANILELTRKRGHVN